MRTHLVVFALALSCGSAQKPPVWTTTVQAGNPLVGKAYDAQTRELVTIERAERATLDVPLVLLGEKHDNADHHRLQARVLAAIVKSGRRPAVLFEMIDLDRQPAIDAYVARADATVDGLATVLEWDKRGWPAWALYRPIFEVALGARLKIVATGLGHDVVRKLVKEGPASLPPEIAAHLHLEPLTPALATSLDDEIKASHCGFLPDAMVPPMSLAQRVKDTLMADLMAPLASRDGAVLVAGNGHVRSDRGVPFYLHHARSISISFVEVSGAREPGAYVADEPARFVVFTPRVDDDDPCKKFQSVSR